MHYFDSNPQLIKLTDQLASDLRSGFMLLRSQENVEAGEKILAVVNQLSPTEYSVRCTVFEVEGDAPDGTKWRRERTLGYLTQAGADALQTHRHPGCEERLELRLASDAPTEL